MNKKKERIDVIEVGEYDCKKMGMGLFYNLDDSLAIIIRDALRTFANRHTNGCFPGYYMNDPRLDKTEVSEAALDDAREDLWRNDILEVSDEFDKYLRYGKSMEPNEIDEMFAKLAFIFPTLWT